MPTRVGANKITARADLLDLFVLGEARLVEV